MTRAYEEGFSPSRRPGQEQVSMFKRGLKPDVDPKTGQPCPLRPTDLEGRVWDFDKPRHLDHRDWKLKKVRGYNRDGYRKTGCPNCSYRWAWTHPNSEKAWCYRCRHKFDY